MYTTERIKIQNVQNLSANGQYGSPKIPSDRANLIEKNSICTACITQYIPYFFFKKKFLNYPSLFSPHPPTRLLPSPLPPSSPAPPLSLLLPIIVPLLTSPLRHRPFLLSAMAPTPSAPPPAPALGVPLLSGAIPPSPAAFPDDAFARNPALCGTPLASCRDVVSDPSRPTTMSAPVPPAANATVAIPVPLTTAIVSSSSSSKPEVAAPDERHQPTLGSMSRVAVVATVVGDFVVLVIVSGLLFCYFWWKFASKNPSRLQEGEKIVYSSSPYTSQGGGIGGGGFERGRMVFFEDAKKFELDELLRAFAEMLGKGGYGTTYKAVLDDGDVVAVKCLRNVQVTRKRPNEGW